MIVDFKYNLGNIVLYSEEKAKIIGYMFNNIHQKFYICEIQEGNFKGKITSILEESIILSED